MQVEERAADVLTVEREHSTELLAEAAESCAGVVLKYEMKFERRLNCKMTGLEEGSDQAKESIDRVTSDNKVSEVYLGRLPIGDTPVFLTAEEGLETGFTCRPGGELQVSEEVFDLFPIWNEFLKDGVVT